MLTKTQIPCDDPFCKAVFTHVYGGGPERVKDTSLNRRISPSERHAMTTSKLSRAQVVQAQLKALQAEMAHLARFPEDNFPEHTVLMTQKTCTKEVLVAHDRALTSLGVSDWAIEKRGVTYTYVLLKANGQWWMTGTNGHGINGANWDKVIDFVDGDDLINVRTGRSVMLDARETVADHIGEEAAKAVDEFLANPETGTTARRARRGEDAESSDE